MLCIRVFLLLPLINVLLVGKTPLTLQITVINATIKESTEHPFWICYNRVCWDCIIKAAFGKFFDIPNKRYIQHTAGSHVNWTPPQHVDRKNTNVLGGALSINGLFQMSVEVSTIWVYAPRRIRCFFAFMGHASPKSDHRDTDHHWYLCLEADTQWRSNCQEKPKVKMTRLS